MKISDLFKNTSDAVCSSINGAMTLRENLFSKINDATSFLNGTLTNAWGLLVTDQNDPYKSYPIPLTKAQYDAALEDEDEEFTFNLGSVDTITLTGKEVIEQFTDQVQQLKIQESFLDYCCSTVENVSSSDFLVRLSNTTGYIAPAAHALYTKCIDLASTPIEALKNFFGSTASVSMQKDANDKITITDLTQYGGDAWVVGISNFWDTVSSFFDGVFTEIYKIKEFFDRLRGAIVKVGKWLFGKAFGYLWTVYEKQGNQSFGYMDMPVLQVECNYQASELYNEFLRLNDMCQTDLEAGIYLYPWNNVAYYSDWSEINDANTYLDNLTHQSVPYTLSGVPAIRDIIIPSAPYNMLLRFGISSNDKRSINLYPCFTVEETSVYGDAEIEKNIRSSVLDCLKIVSSVAPFCPISQNSDDVDAYFENFVSFILPSTLSGKLSVDLNNKMVGVNLSDLCTDVESETYLAHSQHPLHIIYGLIFYGAIMSDVYFNSYIGEGITYLPSSPPVYVDSTFDVVTYPYVEIPQAFDTSDWNRYTYRPYNKTYAIPCTVHYQTTEEEAAEVQHAIFSIIIAATIIAVTVKTVMAVKNLRIKSELSQAAVDALSWEAATNPTSSNLSNYLKARKKNNKVQNLMRILGLAPKTASIAQNDLNTILNGEAPSYPSNEIIKLIK